MSRPKSLKEGWKCDADFKGYFILEDSSTITVLEYPVQLLSISDNILLSAYHENRKLLPANNEIRKSILRISKNSRIQ